ncbi:MAG: hypothetical protein KY442_12650 [Proteobacteria bacterium]|nr:hypothetical protein [Pseudomonadota bacterium]
MVVEELHYGPVAVVQRFDERELEAALEIELDDEQVRSLAGEPVLVATSIRRACAGSSRAVTRQSGS